MIQKETYQHNLNVLREKNPLLAFQISITDKRTPFASNGKKIDRADLEEIEVLYMHGLDRFDLCISLLSWLHQKETRKMVLLEEDLSIFASFLEEEGAMKILEDPQIKICSIVDGQEENLKKIVWSHLFSPYYFIEGSREKSKAVHSLLDELQMGAELTMCLYRDFGIAHMKNLFRNLLDTKIFRRGESLDRKFKDIPAIICGAGPSLESNISELKKLQGQALLFAGGSALNTLSIHHLPIHFGGSLDPELPPYRFLRQTYFELPFFYQNRLDHAFYRFLQGPKLCFGDNEGFPLEKWLMENLQLGTDSFDAGWNVATFLTHVAATLGCNPIIFIGMECAKTEGGIYSAGVEQIEEGKRYKREDRIECVDRFGEAAFTRPDFLMGKNWLEIFAQIHPSIQFFNASEKGLNFEGIENKKLSALISKFEINYDLEGLIHATIESGKVITVDKKEVLREMEKMKKSMHRCQTLFLELLGLLESDIKKTKPFEEGRYALQMVELGEELFYQTLLLPIWNVWKCFFQKDAMESHLFEKKIQETLFYQEVTHKYLEMMENTVHE